MRSNNMADEKWNLEKREVEEYTITRRGANTYFLYSIRIERDKNSHLRKLTIDMTSGTIELPPVAFKIFGILVSQGILTIDELLGH